MSGTSVFISYKHGDAESEVLLETLMTRLEQRGHKVLVDRHVEPGSTWSEELYGYLMTCDAAIVIASSLALESDWCQREWAILACRASTCDLTVLPICVGELPSTELRALASVQAVSSEEPIQAVLQALESVRAREIRADDFHALHHAWNEHLFAQARVFDKEAFALADVYVTPECRVLTWADIASGQVDPFDEKDGARTAVLEAITHHIAKPRNCEPIVVQGAAGSGKSAMSLYLARELQKIGFTVSRIRFKDLRIRPREKLSEALVDALRIGPEHDDCPRPQEDLFGHEAKSGRIRFRGREISSHVIILDGWDEVTLAGTQSMHTFFTDWLWELREHFLKRAGLKAQLILTGRPSLALKQSKFLRPDTPVLTLRPMRPEQLSAYSCSLCSAASWDIPESRRVRVIERYASEFEKPDSTGIHMIGLPLLAMLAFRTIARAPDDDSDILSSPTALYHSLIQETAMSGGKSIDDPDRLDPNFEHDARKLLGACAATISALGGEERITLVELKTRLNERKSWGLPEFSLDEIGDDDAGLWHDFVAKFYFKEGRGGGKSTGNGTNEIGCEFLHRSFREYLFAECIRDTLVDIVSDFCREGRAPRNTNY